MNLRKEEYEKLKNEKDEELIAISCDFHNEKQHLAKFIYENRCRSREHDFNLEQIELQHEKNIELLKKELAKQEELLSVQLKSQRKLMIISVIITAIATLSAALAGAFYTHTLHLSEQTILQTTHKQGIQQYQSAPSNSSQVPSAILRPVAKDEAKQKK